MTSPPPCLRQRHSAKHGPPLPCKVSAASPADHSSCALKTAHLPAAIYLGGAGQTVVRAIDSDVVELFLRAEVSGNGGDNNTGGGITHSSVIGNLNSTQAGALKVIIEPAATVSNGRWQLNPETTLREGGSQKSGLSPGTYNLTFSTIAGFQPPTPQTVTVSGGQLTTVTFTYQEVVTETPTVVTPTISPNGGSHTDSVTVSLNTTTNGATIRYTTDSSTPTSTSTKYNGAFTLTSSATVRAKAFKDGSNDSDTASASFTITQTPAFLTLDEANKGFTNAGGNHTFGVNSNTSWSWTKADAWITTSEQDNQSNDQLFSYSLSANTSTSTRSGSITFTAGGITRTHSISQQSSAASTSINLASKTAASAGESYEIEVSSNTSWTAVSNQLWATVNPAGSTGDGSVTVTVAVNPTTSQRTATITIGGQTHVLIQEAAPN